MKQIKELLIMSFVLLCVAGTVDAQSFVRSTTSTGFEISQGTETGETITILGKNYNIHTSKKGSKYIPLPSKKGGMYPFWIGAATSYEFEGKKVRRTTGGKYFVFKLSSRGLPYYDFITLQK